MKHHSTQVFPQILCDLAAIIAPPGDFLATPATARLVSHGKNRHPAAMSSLLSRRMATLQPSPIVRIAQQATDLAAAGHTVYNLSIGVPGFLPPPAVLEAAKTAVDGEKGTYLPGRGSQALLTAFQGSLAARGFPYHLNEICAQPGGKGALFNLLLALVNDGDRVVIPAPYWTSYPEMLRLAGGVPVMPFAPASQNYKLTPAQLEAALYSAHGAKGLIFNSPSNPSGAVYSRDELTGLAAVLKPWLVADPARWIISDDIYDFLYYPNSTETALIRAPHLLDADPTLKPQLIIVQSVSKTYGMPGWRVGLVAGRVEIISALVDLASQSFTNLPAASMAAAAAALTLPLASFLPTQLSRLRHQRDLALTSLTALKLPCPVPHGAFYVLPDCTPLLGRTTAAGTRLDSDGTLAAALLTEAHVATVPGAAFGAPGTLRLSTAGPEESLKAGLSAMRDFVKSLT